MRSENLRGIVLMLLAMVALSLMDATMKELSERYPALQVAGLRGLVSLPFVVGWVLLRERSVRTLVEVRWGWHLVRGALAILMLTSFIYAISSMPLSEAYTLFFVSPLLITALSVPLLGEVVGRRRWFAVIVGFAGVLVVLRPGFVALNLATLAVLVSAVCYALNAVSVNILGRTDSTAAMSFWFMVMVAIGAGLLALPNWQPVQLADAGWLLGLGITGALGQFWITAAFRCAPISVVAPFEYSTLFWGVILDLVIWGELPAPVVFVGAAVIIGSGLYLIFRERQIAAADAAGTRAV
ncbi:MAG: DMT family transporter [Woeseiaceae bacterium]|nr:DMT family transporter [Woeseiaceae bacterium]